MVDLIFLFKQKTGYEMRISDWSSDVCPSELAGEDIGAADIEADFVGDVIADVEIEPPGGARIGDERGHLERSDRLFGHGAQRWLAARVERQIFGAIEIGSASCRERVCQYV